MYFLFSMKLTKVLKLKIDFRTRHLILTICMGYDCTLRVNYLTSIDGKIIKVLYIK